MQGQPRGVGVVLIMQFLGIRWVSTKLHWFKEYDKVAYVANNDSRGLTTLDTILGVTNSNCLAQY